MSNGGRFILTINTGLQDQLLSARELLNKRIEDIIKKRYKNKNSNYTEVELNSLPKEDYFNLDNHILPSLNDLETTHNVFVNSSIKPHIPISFEYIKTKNNNPSFGNNVKFTLPQVGNFINDIVFHFKIKGLRAKSPKDRVRFTAFPGHRLIEKTSLLINSGAVLDEYGTEDYNNYYNFHLCNEAKKKAWRKNVGQEEKIVGTLTQDPDYNMEKEYRLLGDGFQTLKYKQDEMDLFIPALFWFCKDVKNSIPSHILPWGKLQIELKLTELKNLISVADYGGGGEYIEPKIEFCDMYVKNLFTTDEFFKLYARKFLFSIMRVHRTFRKTIKSSNLNGILLNEIKHPTEHMYISFRPRQNLELSQSWYKNSVITEKTYKVPVVAKNDNNILTGNVVSSTENTAVLTAVSISGIDNIYNGFDFIITEGTGFIEEDIIKNRYIVQSYNGTTKEITIIGNWNGLKPDSTTKFELFTLEVAINSINYKQENPVISNLSLKALDNYIIKPAPERLFNYYTSFHNNYNICPPEEIGSYFINFNIHPMEHNPSGSINFSSCREIYLNFDTDKITSDYPVDIIVCSTSLNFLIINDNKISFRYL
jgi:hypothetical protein